MKTYTASMAIVIALLSSFSLAGWVADNLDDSVGQIAGNDEVARAAARQALRRVDPVEAVHKLTPLVGDARPQVYSAAMNTSSDSVG